MLDKEKLWLGFKVSFPNDMDKCVCHEFLCNIARSLENFCDESVKPIMLQSYNGEGKDIETDAFCIYDPNNGDDEKYNQFFEDAKRYIKEFEKSLKNKE